VENKIPTDMAGNNSTRERILSLLLAWNQEKHTVLSETHRRYVNQVATLIKHGKNVHLRGPRGVGKSLVIKDFVSSMGMPKRAVRIDMDHPGSSMISVDLIEEFVNDFKDKNGPVACVAVDEARFDDIGGLYSFAKKNNILLVTSRSSGHGHGIIFEHDAQVIDVFQESFGEYIILSTGKPVDMSKIREHIDGYILGKSENKYYYQEDKSINIFRAAIDDIVYENEIRNTKLLTDISVYIASSPLMEVSANGIKSYFSCSIDLSRAFLSHIERSGLISLARRVEDMERPAQSKRICIPSDVRICRALSAKVSLQQAATVSVFRELRALVGRVYMKKTRAGLAMCSPKITKTTETTGPVPNVFVFVSYPYRFDDVSSEIGRFSKKENPKSVTVLSADDEGADIWQGDCEIRVRPLWSWMAFPDDCGLSTDIKVDMAENDMVKKKDIKSPPKAGSMPSHLL
jgi:predicted AAA+ superfamily ATPase